MKYLNKEIRDLSDQELTDAVFALAKVQTDLETKRQDKRFIAKFKNQPLPTTNPLFDELKAAIDAEFVGRGLGNVVQKESE